MLRNWTRAQKPAHTTLGEFFTQRFAVDDAHCRMRVLDSAVVWDDTVYVALEWEMKDLRYRQVIGVVLFVQWAQKTASQEICWHEMTESMFPQAFDCPEHILQKLTPTDDPNALRWRKLCRQRTRALRPQIMHRQRADIASVV